MSARRGLWVNAELKSVELKECSEPPMEAPNPTRIVIESGEVIKFDIESFLPIPKQVLKGCNCEHAIQLAQAPGPGRGGGGGGARAWGRGGRGGGAAQVYSDEGGCAAATLQLRHFFYKSPREYHAIISTKPCQRWPAWYLSIRVKPFLASHSDVCRTVGTLSPAPTSTTTTWVP